MGKEKEEPKKKYSQLSDEEEAQLSDAEALDAFYSEIEEDG
jgi:hypothetical protein